MMKEKQIMQKILIFQELLQRKKISSQTGAIMVDADIVKYWNFFCTNIHTSVASGVKSAAENILL